MPKKKSAVPVTFEEVDFANDPLLLGDSEINKQTGIWKRAQEQIGIPRSRRREPKYLLR